MSSLRLRGRSLWLSTSLSLMQRQLAGDKLTAEKLGSLRDDVSTDEITPVAILSYYDDRLSRYPYTGFQVEDQYPVSVDAVRHGDFSVTIAGKRYGKGSSREHSPAAEKWAGIQLVIAESFERIYRQNADNIGLFTSTDTSLAAVCDAGSEIPLERLLQGRDALSAAILRCGGLLAFGQRYMREVQAVAHAPASQPQTLFEKIVSRHWLQTEVTAAEPRLGEGGFVRADWRFIHEYYTGMCAHMLDSTFGAALRLRDPNSVVVFEDHSSYVEQSPAHVRGGLVVNMQAMCQAQRDFVAEHGLTCHRTLTEQEALQDDGRHVAGISHAMMAEHYALPGQLIAGTDSHTPHSGALGCVAFGVGTTDMANALVTGAVRITMPPVLRVWIQGALPAGVTAKDVVLHLLARDDIRSGAKLGQVFEFAGPVVRAMSIDERATMTNMVAELGGMTGIVEPDERTVAFLRERRGIDFKIEPWMCSDPGARYSDVIELDVSQLSPMVARPGDPGRGLALDDLAETVRVDIAYGGSCTAGKREDFDHYHAVLAWALDHGWRKPDHVRLYLQFGTTAVRDYCQSQGYLPVFQRAGAVLLQPSCGACANCGPGSSTEPTDVTVSAINRNFPGRSGPGRVWLASPPTVVASAMAGRLVSFDTLKSLKPPS
jgi:3-isopropylmalate/(R)-2-methylmalate dehydratase large subunit